MAISGKIIEKAGLANELGHEQTSGMQQAVTNCLSERCSTDSFC